MESEKGVGSSRNNNNTNRHKIDLDAERDELIHSDEEIVFYNQKYMKDDIRIYLSWKFKSEKELLKKVRQFALYRGFNMHVRMSRVKFTQWKII